MSAAAAPQARARVPALAFERVTCAFAGKNAGERYTAVADASFVVGDGEFVSVVGPTGCGKSTLLNV
ncbi:MAG TPA: ATP-binding cassette domain-containing protein, partial [Casimicrobiaceae bacterium]